VLDEPSIGLHPCNQDDLLRTLEELRDLGNTVVVVEHDEAAIRRADHVVEIGPAPGAKAARSSSRGHCRRYSPRHVPEPPPI